MAARTTTKKKKGAGRQARGRGTVAARGPGKWLVRVYLGTDSGTGKRKYSGKVVAGTRKDAEQELTRMLREIDTNQFVPPSKRTLAEYLEGWLDGPVRRNVSVRTLNHYRRSLENYVYPAIGRKRLDQVTRADVEALLTSLEKRGLKANSVRLIMAPLRQAMKYAVEVRELAVDPCEYVRNPRCPRRGERIKALTPAQAGELLEALKDDRLYALWALLLLTGLRPGEALALKWEDLSEDWTRLHVRRALTKTTAGRFELAPPKTATSVRAVTLPGEAIEALKEHRKAQNREILRWGRKYVRRGFVFATATGKHLDPTRVGARWRTLRKRLGLEGMRLYDFRHTHATLLAAQGVNPKVVQQRLGHADVTLTLNTYTHAWQGADEAAAMALGDLLKKAAAC